MSKVVYTTLVFVAGLIIGYQYHDRFVSEFIPTTNHSKALDLESRIIRLNCLTDDAIKKVRTTASISALFLDCRDELSAVLDKHFGSTDDDTLRAILSAIVASNFAEYGDSNAITFNDIAKSAHLNCGNTILLAGYLYGVNDRKLRSIGFDGGVIGNHAQLYYSGQSKYLLDTTVGLIAKTSFNDLLRGIPIQPDKIMIFGIKAQNLDAFRDKVYSALNKGGYRPRDFMYMHSTIAEHLEKGSLESYFTPGGIYLRNRQRQR